MVHFFNFFEKEKRRFMSMGNLYGIIGFESEIVRSLYRR